ncbi:2-keto-4-pentenoate hydratase [Lysinibacillus composti]|uniref:2-keto-4-pentenoate hydratase n=1 Tax=Lysinibacillus composti TaxID=720633 RepID=A0A3N9UR19_9BACI|nr:2-keto-4-pentenoate hydratase [Lysinibacillus composti]MBM7609404.1 2-keto-4-pentenoate hydratase [Lysinibacillus composti]RQW74346.1 2-keto-4-pentenoate hydratase [Lysinibacillus composti]
MNIQAAANALLEAERSKNPIAPFTSLSEEITVQDAYGIQLQYIQSKLDAGATLKGMKIGLTSKAMQDMLKVYTPDYGHILDTMVYEPNSKVEMDQFIQPKVEFEIAFVLNKDLKGPNVTVEDVLDATDYVVPAIEIIDSRIEDWKIKFEDTVADNGSSAGAVLGEQKTSVEGLDLAAVEMNAYKNGELFDSATGAAVLGDPAKAVAWLANELASYDIQLGAGDFVLAGALSKAVPFNEGDEFEADFGVLGKVGISFVKAGVVK